MDPFTALRFSSLFDPSQGGMPMGGTYDPNADSGPTIMPTDDGGGAPQSSQSATPPLPVSSFGSGGSDMNPDVSAMMAKLYQPDTAASDALKQLLTNPPKPPNPGLLRRLLAGGVAGIKGMENTRMEPLGVKADETPQEAGNAVLGLPKYQQALNEWRQSVAGAQTLANTEKAANAQQRMAAAQTVNDLLKSKHEDEVNRHNLAMEQNNVNRTNIMNFAEQHKEYQFIMPKGGNYMFVNPLTHETFDTGIKTGTLDQMTEMTLANQGKVNVADINAGAKGVPGEITDPNDPTGTKKISVMIHPDGTATPIKYQGQAVEGNKTSAAPPVDNEAVQKQTEEIKNKTRDALSVIDELMDKNNKLINNEGLGLTGTAFRAIPGTKAYDNSQAVNRLKGMLTLDLINQMRAASKSGSTGFGRITNQELQLLQNTVGQLNMGQSPENFEKQLAIIKQKLNETLLPSSANSPTVTVKGGVPLSPVDGWRYVAKPGGGFTAVKDPTYKAPAKSGGSSDDEDEE